LIARKAIHVAQSSGRNTAGAFLFPVFFDSRREQIRLRSFPLY